MYEATQGMIVVTDEMISFHQSKNKKTRLIGILELEEKKESLLSATRTGNWRLGGNSADPAKTRLRLS